MKEEFLHYLWKYGLYDHDSLIDGEGNLIRVTHPGEYNRDAGPDFFNARIKTGGTEWAGNIEIHSRASHFFTHGHHTNPAFNNVILHVVEHNDKKVFNARGEELLTVELKFDQALCTVYESLMTNPATIACHDDLDGVDNLTISSWLNFLTIERLERKSEQVFKILAATGNDWEETLFRMVTRYFGFRVNAEPFEMLSVAIPFRIIRKHSDNRFQVEALLFGAAGMLEEGLFREAINDDYYRMLIKEYRILASKYSLKPIHGWLWKFSKLRPVNFPTIRISQMAEMFSTPDGLFSKVLAERDPLKLRRLFDVTASEYWNDHFIFGKKSRLFGKNLGEQAVEIILINAIIPVLFTYGRRTGDSDISARALDCLEALSPEKNLVIREWENAGLKSTNASDSQALLQLKEAYCKKRRCLDCRIGNKLIISGVKLRDPKELLLEP